MNDDVAGLIALLLLPFALVAALAIFAVYAGMLLAVLAVPIGIGVGVNLLVRAGVNHSEWWQIDEGLVWLLIALLALVPLIGAVLAIWACVAAVNAPTVEGRYPVLAALAYLLWLGGYLWAWRDPRFEQGKGDVLMVKTLILAWTRFTLRRQIRKLESGLPRSEGYPRTAGRATQKLGRITQKLGD